MVRTMYQQRQLVLRDADESEDEATRWFNGKPSVVFVPASPVYEGRTRGVPRCSEVSISRRGSIMTVDCQCRPVYGDGESEECEGMKHGKICYHALAAAITCATEANVKMTISEIPDGSNGTIVAGYGGGKVYVRYAG